VPRPHHNRSLAVLALASLAFSLAQTMVIPALGDLASELDTDATGVAWTLTGYLLAAAVATPVAGRLGDMFGKRRMLVLSLALFGGGAVVSAVGGTLHLVVLGRLLQGLGVGLRDQLGIRLPATRGAGGEEAEDGDENASHRRSQASSLPVLQALGERVR
jgi:MFS family permease